MELILPFIKLLGHKLEIRNMVKRENLLTNLSKMDFLINLENRNCPTQIPSKLIDYSISNRPILSLNPVEINKTKFEEFLNGNYNGRLTVSNLNQYQIKNVAASFIDLIK